LTAATAAFTAYGSDWLTLEAQNLELVLNHNTNNWPGGFGPAVIDWAATEWNDGNDTPGLQVPTGASPDSETVTIGWDGNQRMGISVEKAVVRLLDFIHLQGSFFIEKGPQQLVEIATGIPAKLGSDLGEIGLADYANQITSQAGVNIGPDFATISGWDVATMVLGMSGVMGFAGLGSPDFNNPNWADDDDLFGVKLDNMDLALGIMETTFPVDIPGLKTFLGLRATADQAAFVTVGSDWMEVTVEDVEVVVNTNSGTWPGGLGPAVIDWSATQWNDGDDTPGLQVPTGAKNPDGSNKTISLNMDGNQRIGAEIGYARINLFDFFHLQGSFGFEMGPTYKMDVRTVGLKGLPGLDAIPTKLELEMSSMTFGGCDISAFVGFGGMKADGEPTAGSVGISVKNIDFGLAIFMPTVFDLVPALEKYAPTFLALNAHVDEAALFGLEPVLEAKLYDVTLQANLTVIGMKPFVLPAYIDFKSSSGVKDGKFEVKTGGKPVTIDYDSFLVRAAVGFFEMQVASMIYLAGSMALDAGQQMNVTLTDGRTTEVLAMTIAASNVYGFVGFDGPYRSDTNDDYVIDDKDETKDGAVGFSLEDLDLAIGIFKALPFIDPSIFFSLSASLKKLELVGVPGVTAEANSFKLDINAGIINGFIGPAAIDFLASFPEQTGTDTDGDGKPNEPAGYEVLTGGEPIYFGYSSTLVAASGQVKLNILEIIEFDGDFEFEFKLDDSETSLKLVLNGVIAMKVGGATFVSGTAVGFLQLDKLGLLGYVDVSLSAGEIIPGFELQGRFQLEINTTKNEKQVSRFVIDDDGNPVPDGQGGYKREMVKIAASSARLYLGGKLIVGPFELVGNVEFVVVVKDDENTKEKKFEVEVSINAHLKLGGFGNVAVAGGARIGFGDAPYFVAFIEFKAEMSIAIITIKGDFTLQINTSASAQTINGKTVNPETFIINANVEMKLWVLTAQGTLTISYTQGLFEAKFEAKINFFIVEINVEGFIRSDGKFRIHGEAKMTLDLAVFKLNGKISITLSSEGFAGRAEGSVELLGIKLAGIAGGFQFTAHSVKLDITITILGADLHGSLEWSFGPPPNIADKEGSTVRLNMGSDAWRRGDAFKEDGAETFSVSGSGKKITVHAFNVSETFDGVDSIVVYDAGKGNDYIYIGAGITANLGINGGVENDTIIVMSDSSATLQGGSGDDQISVYAGTNSIHGGGGDDIISTFGGTNTIYGDNGDDTLTASAGSNTMVFGDGWGKDVIGQKQSADPCKYLATDEKRDACQASPPPFSNTLDFSGAKKDIIATINSLSITDGQGNTLTDDHYVVTGVKGTSAGDRFEITSFGSKTLMLDGSGGDDRYQVNVTSTASGSVDIADSGSGSDSDTLHFIGTAEADTLTVGQSSYHVGGLSGDYGGVEIMRVKLDEGDDTLNINALASNLTDFRAELAEGDDQINYGDTLSAIASRALVHGGPGENSYTISNSGGTADTTGAINPLTLDNQPYHAITGLGMAGSIVFNAAHNLTITLGQGADTFTSNAAPVPGSYTVNGFDGEDTITVQNTSTATVINGDAGEDTITVQDANAQLVVNGNAGEDTITVQDANAHTIVNGGDDPDTITLQNAHATIELNGDGDNDIITLEKSADHAVINGGADFDHITVINPGTTAELNGDDGDDRFYLQAVAAGGQVTINGGVGADKYFVSNTAERDCFLINNVFDDDGPDDSPLFTLQGISGDLSDISGTITIDGGANGNGGTVDRVYFSEGGKTADASLDFQANTMTGLGQGGAGKLSYSNVETVYYQMGSGNDTINVDSLPAELTLHLYGGAGNESLSVGHETGSLSAIDGYLHLYGEEGEDSFAALHNGSGHGQLTAVSLSGFGMGSNSLSDPHIFYAQQENGKFTSNLVALTLTLGDGSNKLLVDSTYGGFTTTIKTGGGNDVVQVGNTPYGLDPNNLRNISGIGGPLELVLGSGYDKVIIDDSGNSLPRTATFDSGRLSNFNAKGDITVTEHEALEVGFGAQNDTLVIRSSAAGSNNQFHMGGGFDTVTIGNDAGTLDDLLGDIVINGGEPYARDTLLVNDANTTADHSYTVTSEGGNTTISRSGAGGITYAALETVSLLAGKGDNAITLAQVHRDEDPGGGKAASFALQAGDGDDTIAIGRGGSLDAIDIMTLIDAGAGTDRYILDHSAASEACTFGVLNQRFEEIFPASTSAQLNFYSKQLGDLKLATTTQFTTTPLGLVSDPQARVIEMGLYARNFEALDVTLGSGDDVIRLVSARYDYDLALGGGGGDDTFEVDNGVLVNGDLAINGDAGDDILVLDFSRPSAIVSRSINYTLTSIGGSTHTAPSRKLAAGTYYVEVREDNDPGSGEWQFRLVNDSGAPIEIKRVGSAEYTAAWQAIIDGLVSFDSGVGVILDFAAAAATAATGATVANTVTGFGVTQATSHSHARLDNGEYFVEVRENGVDSDDWEFRLLASDGKPVAIAEGSAGDTLTGEWQDISAGDYDSDRGLTITFGDDSSGYSAAVFGNGKAASVGFTHFLAGDFAGGTAAQFTFVPGTPAGTLNFTYNGGENGADGDTLRIAGDGDTVATYTPSATTPRAGLVNAGGNQITFTGVEPLVLHGMASVDTITPENPDDVVVESIDLADLDIKNLVLHVLVVDGVQTWRQQAKLEGLGMALTKNFGHALAVAGDRLAVGSLGNPSASGIVNIYSRSGTNWAEDGKIYFDNAAGPAGFGYSVALAEAADAYTLVVGAPYDDTKGAQSGSAYVYRLGNGWEQQTILYPGSATVDANFGYAVDVAALSESEFVIGVGAPGANAAYRFECNHNVDGICEQPIQQNGPAGSRFGHAVVVDGGNGMVVGAPGENKVYAYYGATPQTIDGPANSEFGFALDVLGTRLAVGAPRYDEGGRTNTGAVFTYTGPTFSSVSEVKHTIPDGQRGAQLGYSVALGNDRLTAGAPYYDATSTDQGAVYQGYRDTWNLVVAAEPAENDRFGTSVAMYGVDLEVVAGIPGHNDGEREDVGAVASGNSEIVPAEVTLAKFGFDIAIDGNTVLVGAPLFDGRGAAHVFIRDCGTCDSWSLQATLQGQDTIPGDLFGYSVALYGDVAVVGAPGAGAERDGAVYVFERSGVDWSQQARFAPEWPSEYHRCIEGCRSKALGNMSFYHDLYEYGQNRSWLPGDSFRFGISVDIDASAGGNTFIVNTESGYMGKPHYCGPGCGNTVIYHDWSFYLYMQQGGVWEYWKHISWESPNWTPLDYGPGPTMGRPEISLEDGIAINALQWWDVDSSQYLPRFGGSDGGYYVDVSTDYLVLSTGGGTDVYSKVNGVWQIHNTTKPDVIRGYPHPHTKALATDGEYIVWGVKDEPLRYGHDGNLDAVQVLASTSVPWWDGYRWCNLTKTGYCWNFSEAITLTGSDIAVGDDFGHTVDISGSLVVAGAPQVTGRSGDAIGTNGNAYIFITEKQPPLAVLQPEAVDVFLAGAKVTKATGTTGGTALSDLYVFDTPTVTLNVGAGANDDSVTIGESGVKGYGLQSFTIDTGAGNDTVTINTGDLSLPTAGQFVAGDEIHERKAGDPLSEQEAQDLYNVVSTSFTINGGDGDDRLNVVGSADFVLDGNTLTSNETGLLTFNAFEQVGITGGDDDDSITARNFDGTLAVDGGAGSDQFSLQFTTLAEVSLRDSAGDADKLTVLATDEGDNIWVTAQSIQVNNLIIDYPSSSIEILQLNGLDGDDRIVVDGTATDLLTISGGPGYDWLTVNANANANHIVIDGARITIDTSTVEYDTIERLDINGRDGDDTIIVENTVEGVSLDIEGNGGGDLFRINGASDSVTLSDLGDGDYYDIHYSLVGTGLVSLGGNHGAAHRIGESLTFPGTDGDDTLVFNHNALTLNGSQILNFGELSDIAVTTISVSLGKGKDTTTFAGLPSDRPLILSLYGDSGNDSFDLGNLGNFDDGLKGNLVIDGGAGSDSLTLSGLEGNGSVSKAGVSGFNLEKGVNYNAVEQFNFKADNAEVTLAGIPGDAVFTASRLRLDKLADIEGNVEFNSGHELLISNSNASGTARGTLTTNSFSGFGMGGTLTFGALNRIDLDLRSDDHLTISGTGASDTFSLNDEWGEFSFNTLSGGGGGFADLGRLTVTSTGTLTLNDIDNKDGTVFDASAPTLTIAGEVKTTSGCTIQNTTNLAITGSVNCKGDINFSAATMSIAGDVSSGTGDVTLTGTTALRVTDDITLTGNDVKLAGSIGVGAAAGDAHTLTVTGNLALAANSQLQLDIAADGASADQIAVSGSATIGDDTALVLGETFTPSGGETFTFITAQGGLTGGFKDLPDGAFISTNYNNSGIGVVADVKSTSMGVEFKTSTKVSINDVTVAEGSSAGDTTSYDFTVTRDRADMAFSVDYATANDSAIAGSDYSPTSGTLNFAGGGALTKTISVLVNQDAVVEADETFNLVLGNVKGFAALANGTGAATISNDDSATLTLSGPASINEGNDDKTVSYDVTVNAPVQGGFEVAFSDTGTATKGTDYDISATGTLSFSGDAFETKQISVTIKGDEVVEDDETLILTLGAISNTSITGGGSTTVTIANDDSATLSISASSPSIAEGDSDQTITFDVTVDAAVQGGFAVAVSNTGTTTSGSDFTVGTTTPLSFTGNANETRQITVTVAGDAVVEDVETITFALGAVTNASLVQVASLSSSGSATTTISDDDSATFTISAPTITESDSDQTVTFDVTVDSAVDGGFKVAFNIKHETTEASDYSVVNTTPLSFAGSANETQQISVTIVGDNVVEDNETFTATLGAVSGSTAAQRARITGSGSATATITNDDSATLTITALSPSITEGDSPAIDLDEPWKPVSNPDQTVNFLVTVDAAVEGGFDVAITNDPGTAEASDYVITTTALTFSGTAGESKSIAVSIDGDEIVEDNETFTLSLGDVSNSTSEQIGKITSGDSASTTINDDDNATLSISAPIITESDRDQTATFLVTVDAAVEGGFEAAIGVPTGTATNGSDYNLVTTGPLSFSGYAHQTNQISVTIIGDLIVEDDETLKVTLVPLNAPSAEQLARISAGSGTATIANDDTATLRISAPLITEGDNDQTVTFDVTVDAAVQGGFAVAFDDTAVTASSNVDYSLATATPLGFTGTANETRQISVTIVGDDIVEDNETFALTLGEVRNTSDTQIASITSGRKTYGTIRNDDTAQITIDDVTHNEGATGTTSYTFTVSISNPTDQPITVTANTADDTATVGDQDYNTVSNQTVTFPANGALTAQITVLANGDIVYEPTESFNLLLSNPRWGGGADLSRATISDGTGVSTLTNDDSKVSIVIDASGNLLITDQVPGGEGNELVLKTDGNDIIIAAPNGTLGSMFVLPGYTTIPGATLTPGGSSSTQATVPLIQVTGPNINFDTLAGNDLLTVDFNTPFNKGINYIGGDPASAPGDTLQLQSGSFTNVTFNYTNQHSGTVTLDSQTVEYSLLEELRSSLDHTNVEMNYSAAGETLTVKRGGADSSLVVSTAGVPTTFKNPAGDLRINAGNAGNDVVDVQGLGANFSGNLVIDGQGGTDTVILENPLPTTTGSLQITGEGINLYSGTLTTTGTQTYQGAVTLGTQTTLTGTQVNFPHDPTSTINGPGGLEIKGNANFQGNIGGTTPLGSVVVTGDTQMDAGVVNTVGEQTYHGDVILSKDTTQTGTTVTYNGTVDSTSGNNWSLNIEGDADFQGKIGGTTPLASLEVTGDAQNDAGTVNTVGAQTYHGAVILSKDTTQTGTAVTYNSTLDSTPGDEWFLDINGDASFQGKVGGTDKLSTIDVSGTTDWGAGTIETSGDQTYHGAVTVSKGTTLIAPQVNFPHDPTSTIDGPGGLVIDGKADFQGKIGGTTPLASLEVTGDAQNDAGTVNTVGAQTYHGAVILSKDTTQTGTTLTYNGTVDSTSGNNWSLDIDGNVDFQDSIGGTQPLNNIDISGSTQINGGSVTTSGTQTYQGTVTLGDNTILNGSKMTFDQTLDGGSHLLAINGDAEFDGAVSGLTTLNVSGATRFDGGSVSTQGTQTYQGPVTLGQNTTLTGTTIQFPNSTSTVDGPGGLDIVGDTDFQAPIGSTTPLAYLSVTGETNMDAGSVRTTGAQSYQDAVTLGDDTTLTGTDVTFTSSIDGAHDLTVNNSGTTSFNGPVGGKTPLTSLTTGGPGDTQINSGSVTTSGPQTYNDPVTLGDNTVLTGSNITFDDTVDSATGNFWNLNINGTAEFQGAIGRKQPLHNININGITEMGAGYVYTSGRQDYIGNVTLTKDTNFQGAVIKFHRRLDSKAGNNWSVNIQGDADFQRPVGSLQPLRNLSINGSTEMNAGIVKTTEWQTYHGHTVLGQDTILIGTQITFRSTLDSANFSLYVDGNCHFDGQISNSGGLDCSGEITGRGYWDLIGGQQLPGGDGEEEGEEEKGLDLTVIPIVVITEGIIIPVTGTLMVALNQTVVSILLRDHLDDPNRSTQPANGDRDLVIFPAGIAEAATLITELLDQGSILLLPDGAEGLSSMTVVLFDSQGPLEGIMLDEPIIVSFVIPPQFLEYEFKILYWDPTLNDGLGDWVEFEPIIMTWDPNLNNGLGGWVAEEEISPSFGYVPSPVESINRASMEFNFTGTFVLVAIQPEIE